MHIMVKVRIDIQPSAALSYAAGFLLIRAFVWYRNYKASNWRPQ